MSDTPRTDRDDRPYPSPDYAQRIRFEGNECVVMHPEEYEALYEHARQLERELNTRPAPVSVEVVERVVYALRIARTAVLRVSKGGDRMGQMEMSMCISKIEAAIEAMQGGQP